MLRNGIISYQITTKLRIEIYSLSKKTKKHLTFWGWVGPPKNPDVHFLGVCGGIYEIFYQILLKKKSAPLFTFLGQFPCRKEKNISKGRVGGSNQHLTHFICFRIILPSPQKKFDKSLSRSTVYTLIPLRG